VADADPAVVVVFVFVAAPGERRRADATAQNAPSINRVLRTDLNMSTPWSLW